MTHAALACTTLLAALAAGAAHAQGYPARPITVIINVAPGAGSDLTGRTVANAMRRSLGEIVVENRPGADGMIGAGIVKRAAPDGYTLLVSPDNILNALALKKSVPVNVFEDLAPVAAIGAVDFFLVVNEDVVPARNLKEFLAIARERGGKLSYASSAAGSAHHLGMELLKMRGGFEAVHVPYKGIGPALPDLRTGRVAMTLTGYPAVANHLKGTKLRVLVVAAPKRSPFRPDVPTFQESGMQDFEVRGSFNMYAPAGTPRPIIDRLNAEVNKALASEEVKATFAKGAVTPVGGSPEDMLKDLKAVYQRWAAVVKAADIQAD